MTARAQPGFGLLLRHFRELCNLTKADLAERADVALRTIEDLESGKIRAPHPRNLDAIIAALRERCRLSDKDAQRLLEAARDARRSYTRTGNSAKTAASTSLRQFEVRAGGLIGRQRELSELHGLLLGNRFVTLTGPPGVGKTRLAAAVGAPLRELFPGGTCFVELDEVVGYSLVGARIALMLGIAEGDRTRHSAEESVVAFLAQHKMMLVLDNFEHVLDAAPLVARLLRETDTTLLVTSRSPLKIVGEHVYDVQPLSTASDKGDDPEAVALLKSQIVEQGQAPERFAAEDLVELCRKLDGIPLAIELAAARTRYLSPRTLADLLSSDLDALGRAPVGTPDRHATMMATIDWSYSLLSIEAQRILRRMSAFEAPADLGSIAKLVGWGDEQGKASQWLIELCESGLLRSYVDKRGERYGLLNVIRQFARARLVEAGEARAAHEAHATVFAMLSRDMRQRAAGAGGYDEPLAEQLNERLADCWAAALWLAKGHAERAALLALAVGEYCELQGRYTQALAAFDLVVACGLAIEGTRGAGAVLRGLGRWTDAAARLRAVLDSLPAEQTAQRAVLLTQLGWVLSLQSEFDQAAVVLNQALEGADANSRALALAQLARIAGIRGSAHQALDYAARAHGRADEGGNAQTRVTVLRILGDAYRQNDDPSRASVVLIEALALARRFGNSEEIGGCLLNLGLAERDLAVGNATLLEAAIDRDREALAVFERIGHGSGRVNAYSNLAEKLGMAKMNEEALAQAMHAVELAHALRFRLGEADALDTLGYVYLDADDPCAATAPLRSAAELFDGLGIVPGREQSLVGMRRAEELCAETIGSVRQES